MVINPRRHKLTGQVKADSANNVPALLNQPLRGS